MKETVSALSQPYFFVRRACRALNLAAFTVLPVTLTAGGMLAHTGSDANSPVPYAIGIVIFGISFCLMFVALPLFTLMLFFWKCPTCRGRLHVSQRVKLASSMCLSCGALLVRRTQ